MTQRSLIAFLFLFSSTAPLAFAQNGSLRSAFLTIDSLYNSGSYLRAEVEARRLFEHTDLNDTVYAEIHKYISFSLIAQGKYGLAKEQITKLLNLDPAYSLDPVLTSPKILTIFNGVKQDFLTSKRPAQKTKLNPIEEGPSVSYRTILFPGWEQFNRGRNTAGAVFLGLGIATLGSGITFEFLRSSARQDYLKEKNPLGINDKYRIYNKYYNAETVSFVAFALIYIASELDVFTASDYPAVTVMSHLQPDGRAGLTFTLTF